MRELPVYRNTSLEERSSSGKRYINTQTATKNQQANRDRPGAVFKVKDRFEAERCSVSARTPSGGP